MCLVIYAGCETSQEVSPWDRYEPAFNGRLVERNRPVRRRLGKPYIYELGAHTGCGCGFLGEDEEGTVEHRRSMADLAEFLGRASVGGDVEVLCCWIGDEGKPADARDVTAADVGQLDFSSTWERPQRIRVRH